MLLRIGVALEIFGTILLSSSLAGSERLASWEAALLAFFDYQGFVSNLLQRRQLLFDRIYNTLYIAFGAIFVIFFCILAIIPEGSMFDVYILLNSNFRSEKLLYIFALFDLVLSTLVVIVALIVFWPFLLWMALGAGSIVGKAFARFLASLIYAIILAPSLITYVLFYLLLSPYLLADKLAIKFGLRPVLGVLGTIMILTGLFIQLLL